MGALVATGSAGWVTACGAGAGDAEDDDGETKPGPSQGASEPCDPELGADACGANLFCAAFDGRKVHTCYPVGSRLPGEECDDDDNCSSNSCTDDVCSLKAAGEACASAAECQSGYCSPFAKECGEINMTVGSSASGG